MLRSECILTFTEALEQYLSGREVMSNCPHPHGPAFEDSVRLMQEAKEHLDAMTRPVSFRVSVVNNPAVTTEEVAAERDLNGGTWMACKERLLSERRKPVLQCSYGLRSGVRVWEDIPLVLTDPPTTNHQTNNALAP